MCVQMYILEKKIFRTTLYNTYAIYTNKSRMFYTNILLGISENWFRVVRCDVFPKHPHTQIPHKRNAKNLFNVHMVRTMNAEQHYNDTHHHRRLYTCTTLNIIYYCVRIFWQRGKHVEK